MLEYLSEIPLPGRTLAPKSAPSTNRSAEIAPLGFVAGTENQLVATAMNRLMRRAPSATTPKLLALSVRPVQEKRI